MKSCCYGKGYYTNRIWNQCNIVRAKGYTHIVRIGVAGDISHNNTEYIDIIWTTYKAYKKQLSYKGYARSFIPCNSRSTNKYANRHYVMYMVDIRINQFFSIHGVKLTKYDEDMYALSVEAQ